MDTDEHEEKGIRQHELFEISGLWELNKLLYGYIEKPAAYIIYELITDQFDVVLNNIKKHPEYLTNRQNEGHMSFCFEQCLASADMLDKKHSTEITKAVYQMLEDKYVELFYIPHRSYTEAGERHVHPKDEFIAEMKKCLKYIESAKLNVPSDIWRLLKELNKSRGK